MSAECCEAAWCDERAITEFMDGAGVVWSLCEYHGDALAIGFPIASCSNPDCIDGVVMEPSAASESDYEPQPAPCPDWKDGTP